MSTVIEFPVPPRSLDELPSSGIDSSIQGSNVDLIITLPDGSQTIAVLSPDEALVLSERLVNDALTIVLNYRSFLPVP
jgi:hypothetical protein